jgi:predicted solute-binding protein
MDTLDLVEAWQELTDAPYVYGFWCGRERFLSDADVVQLQEVHRRVHEVLQQASPGLQGSQDDMFEYLFPPEAEDAVREFLHYAFYHGVLPDVPELAYFSIGGSSSDAKEGSDLR